MPGEWHALTPHDRSSCAQDPSGLHPMYLFIWLFICILYNILYNKPVDLSEELFLNSVSHFSILSNLGGRVWKSPKFVAGQSEVLEVGNLHLAYAVGTVLWDRTLNLWDLMLTPGG